MRDSTVMLLATKSAALLHLSLKMRCILGNKNAADDL